MTGTEVLLIICILAIAFGLFYYYFVIRKKKQVTFASQLDERKIPSRVYASDTAFVSTRHGGINGSISDTSSLEPSLSLTSQRSPNPNTPTTERGVSDPLNYEESEQNLEKQFGNKLVSNSSKKKFMDKFKQDQDSNLAAQSAYDGYMTTKDAMIEYPKAIDPRSMFAKGKTMREVLDSHFQKPTMKESVPLQFKEDDMFSGQMAGTDVKMANVCQGGFCKADFGNGF